MITKCYIYEYVCNSLCKLDFIFSASILRTIVTINCDVFMR